MAVKITDNRYVKNNTSFGGSDIVIMFEDIRIGSLQGISVSVSREKGPIFVLGSATPVSISRGK